MRNTKIKLILLLATVFASLLVVSVVYAQKYVPTDDDVLRVAKNLYCPVCPNTPLDVCETKACQDWRAQIRDQLAKGWNEEQIVAYFVAQYGERVLGEPKRSGFTSMVWVLPLISVILGLVIVWQVLRSWKARQSPQALPLSALPQVPADIQALVEKELRDLE